MKTRFPTISVVASVISILLATGCVSNPPQSENANNSQSSAPTTSSEKSTTVKGLNGWEGEITGKPAAKSRFTSLQIGMSMRQSTDIAGQPTDRGAYMTGKAWIPFYFGSDKHRYELVYRGQGRLIFAGGSLGDFSGGNLIMIIHNESEGGYR
ncbi:MAG: hypothetical protein WCK63_10480 [Betaproteobacteria bacterium]